MYKNTASGYVVSFLLLMGSFGELLAQDTIFTRKRIRIVSKVLEVNPKDVKYQKVPNLNSKVYLIPKQDVIKITYANGIVDTFLVKYAHLPPKPFPTPRVIKYDPRAVDFFRNAATLTVTDLLMGMISFGYEHTSKNGKSVLVIPISFGMANIGITKDKYDNHNPIGSSIPTGAYFYRNKVYSIGIEYNRFSSGQGTVKYYYGPGLQIGQFNYYEYVAVDSQPGSFSIKKNNSGFFSLWLKNGVMIQPAKNYSVSIFGGIGTPDLGTKKNSQATEAYSYSNGTLNNVRFSFGINAGYRF